MDLEFTVPKVVAVIVAVHVLSESSSDGETNWLEGAQLLSVNLIVAILFYSLPEIFWPSGRFVESVKSGYSSSISMTAPNLPLCSRIRR